MYMIFISIIIFKFKIIKVVRNKKKKVKLKQLKTFQKK